MSKQKNKMNLDIFNDILVNIGGINKKELLIHEIQLAYLTKIQLMERMVNLSNKGEDFYDVLQQINNVDSNLDSMAAQLDELGDGENDETV